MYHGHSSGNVQKFVPSQSNYLCSGKQPLSLNFGGHPIDRSLFMDTQLDSDRSWLTDLKEHDIIIV